MGGKLAAHRPVEKHLSLEILNYQFTNSDDESSWVFISDDILTRPNEYPDCVERLFVGVGVLVGDVQYGSSVERTKRFSNMTSS